MRGFLITTLLVLIAGVVLASTFLTDPGFVVVGYHGRLIRTSFGFFVLMLGLLGIVVFLSGYALYRFFKIPRHFQRRSRESRAEKAQISLHKGLLALVEGAWHRAEETLVANAGGSRAPLMHYLGAARAAQCQGAPERREAYLRLAREIAPRSDLVIGLTQAELQLEQRELEPARETLLELRNKHPHHRGVLRLCLKLHRDLGEWDQVLDLLPALKQRKALPADEIAPIEIDAYCDALGRTADTGALERAWVRVPTLLRHNPRVLEVYASSLHRYGQGAKAIPPLGEVLGAQWSTPLVRLYGLIDGADRAAQITSAEQWLASHAEDPELPLTLGRLCLRHGLWGKARYYLELSIQKAPSPEAYRLMSETLEHIGDKAAAAVHCRKGLLLATGFPQP